MTSNKPKRTFLSSRPKGQTYKDETLSHQDASLDRPYASGACNQVQLESRISAPIVPAKWEHNPGNCRHANTYINLQSPDRVPPRHVHAIRPRWSLLPSPTVEVAIRYFPSQEGRARARPRPSRGWFAVSERGAPPYGDALVLGSQLSSSYEWERRA